MELCVDEAITMNPETIIILGGMGSRMDHSLGNVFLLKRFLLTNILAILENDHNRVMLTNKKIILHKADDFCVSFVALTPIVKNVQTKGLKYPMSGRNLLQGSTLAISNEFSSDTAEIDFDEGELLVFLAKD